MFRWHKEIERLNIPASQVFHLERSLSTVQVALPGLPSQEATAYLCVFAVGKGLRVTLVLHLHTSLCLAFYLNEREETPLREADRLIEEGALFAESLGFMLSGMDYRELATGKRDALWHSLPLKSGVEPMPPVAAAAPCRVTEEPSVAFTAPPPANEAVIELDEEAPFAPTAGDEVIIELDEETPFTPRPGVAMLEALSGSETTMRARARKQPPSAEELTARRQKLLESLGRFLASQ